MIDTLAIGNKINRLRLLNLKFLVTLRHYSTCYSTTPLFLIIFRFRLRIYEIGRNNSPNSNKQRTFANNISCYQRIKKAKLLSPFLFFIFSVT